MYVPKCTDCKGMKRENYFRESSQVGEIVVMVLSYGGYNGTVLRKKLKP